MHGHRKRQADDRDRRHRAARPSAWLAALALAATTLACGHEAPPVPELPGVADDEEEWFWRDVLAAPLPGEAAPRDDLLALPSAQETLDALAELGSSGDPAALTTRLAALRDPRIAVALAAAEDLGLSGAKAALPRLVKGLGPFPVDYDVDRRVRAAEAVALARLGNPAGMPLLLTILAEGTDLEADVATLPFPRDTRYSFPQEIAVDGVRALAGTDFGFDTSGSIPDREAATRAARAWWEQQRIPLWAATAPIDDPALVDRVRLLVHHLGAYQLRQIDGARFTLAHLGPGVLPYLEEGLASEDDYVRVHVLEIMGTLAGMVGAKERGRLAVVAAGPLLDDSSPAVAAQAAAACGAAAVPDMLIVALQRRAEPEVVLAIVDALGRTARPAAQQALAAFAASHAEGPRPPDLAAALEAALLATDPSRSPDGFLDLLASADPDVAFPAVERLIELTGSDHGVDPFVAPESRRAALDAARASLVALTSAAPR